MSARCDEQVCVKGVWYRCAREHAHGGRHEIIATNEGNSFVVSWPLASREPTIPDSVRLGAAYEAGFMAGCGEANANPEQPDSNYLGIAAEQAVEYVRSVGSRVPEGAVPVETWIDEKGFVRVSAFAPHHDALFEFAPKGNIYKRPAWLIPRTENGG